MEFVRVAEDAEQGFEVHETTQSYARIEARRLAEALKAFKGVDMVQHTAGGPVVVRVRKET